MRFAGQTRKGCKDLLLLGSFIAYRNLIRGKFCPFNVNLKIHVAALFTLYFEISSTLRLDV